jgi:kynurenine formamidase
MAHMFQMIELTHKLSPDVPTWNGSCGFCLEVKKDYDDDFRVQQIKMHAGVGTHMDAPSHRFQKGCSMADIPLKQLIVPVCVIDVRAKAHADYKVTPQDLRQYEARFGPIAANSLVIAFTGWSRFWGDSKAYRNVDEEGQMHFPAISSEAADYLLQKDVVGIGIDTLSPDALDPEFPVHQILLGHGKYIIENVADCSQMPAQGAYCIALPLRMEGATESPIRLVGIIIK